jgi:hypothetical protein
MGQAIIPSTCKQKEGKDRMQSGGLLQRVSSKASMEKRAS